MFQHFILTRFNLRKKGWDETKSQSKVLTDKWMENRLELFEQYCYSSIKAQTKKDFEWLVFFDKTTPLIFPNSYLFMQMEWTIFYRLLPEK